MSGDVVLEGSDGDVVVGDGPDVGAGLDGPVGPSAVDPIVEASGGRCLPRRPLCRSRRRAG